MPLGHEPRRSPNQPSYFTQAVGECGIPLYTDQVPKSSASASTITTKPSPKGRPCRVQFSPLLLLPPFLFTSARTRTVSFLVLMATGAASSRLVIRRIFCIHTLCLLINTAIVSYSRCSFDESGKPTGEVPNLHHSRTVRTLVDTFCHGHMIESGDGCTDRFFEYAAFIPLAVRHAHRELRYLDPHPLSRFYPEHRRACFVVRFYKLSQGVYPMR